MWRERRQVVRALVGVAFALPGCQLAAQRPSRADMPGDYIVEITERWGRADARLDDLREKEMGPQDIELRFWGGYGLGGTRGIIMRRTNGRWTASRALVRRCDISLPIPVADTLSETSQKRYEVEARRRCGKARAGTHPARFP